MLAEGRHLYRLRTYYEDTDAGGIVYHANYLRFAERARTEALRELGIAHAELVDAHALMFVVRRIKLDYVRPARIDESLTVASRVVRVGAASVDLDQVVERDGVLLVRASVGLACARVGGAAAGRPARLPVRWAAALKAFAGVADGQEA